MASLLNPIVTSHARSISLPSRSHPIIPQILELVFHLRPSEITNLPLSAIHSRLNGLGDLFDVYDKFLLLPQTQQDCNEKGADELLDGLLLLLDVCSAVKDVLSKSKEHIQELQSVLRRKPADEFELVKGIGQYLATRKKAKKVIHKILKDSKAKCTCSMWDNKDNDSTEMVNMSRQVQEVTFTTLQCLMFYVCGFKIQSKVSRWNLVCNVMRLKKDCCVGKAMGRNEFEKMDPAMEIFLHGQKTKKCIDLMRLENVKAELCKLEINIADLEQRLEFLYRSLIKVRVSLLNILNH